jgi:hypothetical protein
MTALLHTYASVTAYVVTHLPNIRAAAELASSIPGRAFSATTGSSSYETAKAHKDMTMQELQCAYSVLEYKHSTLQKRQKRTGGKGNKNSKRTKKDTDTPPRAEDCTHYCHAHGYQSSHTSAQCKVMAGQTSNFSADMRRADLEPQYKRPRPSLDENEQSIESMATFPIDRTISEPIPIGTVPPKFRRKHRLANRHKFLSQHMTDAKTTRFRIFYS